MKKKKNGVETQSANTAQPISQPESGIQTSHISRRQTLKTALAGGAVLSAGSLPAKWSAPVVNSVVLPAHGVTSAATGPWSVTYPEGQDQANVVPLNMAPPAGPLFALKSQFRQPDGQILSGTTRSLARSIADTLIPSANAEILFGQTICVERIDNDGGIAVRWLDLVTEGDSNLTPGSVLFEGTGVLGEIIQLGSDCEVTDGFQYPIQLTEQPNGTLKFIAGEIGSEGTIPRAPCGIGAGDCPQVRESGPEEPGGDF